MSAIKTCKQCGGLYTGGTPLCAGCYFASFAPAAIPDCSAPEKTMSRAERRTLEKEQAKAARRTANQRPTNNEAAVESERPLPGPRRPPKAGSPPASRRTPSPRSNQHPAIKAAPAIPLANTEGAAARSPRRAPTPETGTVCPLCGVRVPPRQMLEHKQRIHGETPVVPSPAQPYRDNQWVSVVSGGLPSLGKNSR